MKVHHQVCDRRNLCRAQKMSHFVDGGRIRITHVASDVFCCRTVWPFRRLENMGKFCGLINKSARNSKSARGNTITQIMPLLVACGVFERIHCSNWSYLFVAFGCKSLAVSNTIMEINSFKMVFGSIRGFISIDIDVSELQVNQCSPFQITECERARNGVSLRHESWYNQIEAFHDSHKCHLDSMQVSKFHT